MRSARVAAMLAIPVVLLAAGCGGGSSGGGGGTSTPPPSGGQVVEIPIASSGLKFTKTTATASAGTVTLSALNPQSSPHDISIKGNGVNKQGKVVGKGGKSTVSASLKPGKYTFYCSVPGHEAGGMKGTLTVK